MEKDCNSLPPCQTGGHGDTIPITWDEKEARNQ